MDANACKEKAERYAKDVAQATAKYERLKDMDLFVLDNSIRESTVGQLRGHTLEDKWAIYEEARKCGFGNYVVASFNHMTRVDDVFIEQLIRKGADPATLWAFSEITDGKFNFGVNKNNFQFADGYSIEKNLVRYINYYIYHYF